MLGTSEAKNHQQNINTKWRENKKNPNLKVTYREVLGSVLPKVVPSCPWIRGSLPGAAFSLPPLALTWRGKAPPNLTLHTQRSPGHQGLLSFPFIFGFPFQARIKNAIKKEIVLDNSRAKSGAYGKKKKSKSDHSKSRRVEG